MIDIFCVFKGISDVKVWGALFFYDFCRGVEIGLWLWYDAEYNNKYLFG